jgi:hypothetical protein
MMFDALVVWATLYLLVALGLWYATVRQRRIAESIRGRKIERLRERRWRLPNWRSLPSWLLEQLDDLYVMEWMDRTGWAGRLAKVVVVLFVASPIWILGTLWLVLMGKFLGTLLHVFGGVF